MKEPDPTAWEDSTTSRERVRMVVEMLDEPATVSEIEEAADVSWQTANDELQNMVAEHKAREVAVDGKTKYKLDHKRFFLDQILDLVESHTRDELEDQLIEYQERIEELSADLDAENATDLRQRLAEIDRSAEEMRQIRNAVDTWEALETERRLISQALNLYDPLTEIEESDDRPDAIVA